MINTSLKELERGNCIICEESSWIYVLEKQEGKINKFKKFVCMEHYKELLEQYLENNDSINYNLFPEDLSLIEIPYKEARELFGLTSPKIMLMGYIEYLEKKIQIITSEIESFKQMDISEEDHLVSMLSKEKLDKQILKLISQIQIKEI